jgi:hypothetical protein
MTMSLTPTRLIQWLLLPLLRVKGHHFSTTNVTADLAAAAGQVAAANPKMLQQLPKTSENKPQQHTVSTQSAHSQLAGWGHRSARKKCSRAADTMKRLNQPIYCNGAAYLLQGVFSWVS